MKDKHIPEEKIIDYALGNIAQNNIHDLEEHIQSCPKCRESLNNWQGIFDEEIAEKPSADLDEKIWSRVVNQTTPVRKNRKPLIFTIGSAAAIILLAIGLIYYRQSITPAPYQVAHNEEINTDEILFTPETRQMEVIPVADFNDVQGNLWVNDTRKEMLLEVDGLIQHTDYDYQLWIIYNNNDIDGEVLPIYNGSSKIYFKGMDIQEFKKIKASLEPTGGSEIPTGPETFVIPLDSK